MRGSKTDAAVRAALDEMQTRERTRAAALVRAFADGRPAGEVPSLLKLAHTIETGTRHTMPVERVRICTTCGAPENNHPYRHQFKAT